MNLKTLLTIIIEQSLGRMGTPRELQKSLKLLGNNVFNVSRLIYQF